MSATQSDINNRCTTGLYNALMVITRDEVIRSFLLNADERAYNQCMDALSDYLADYKYDYSNNKELAVSDL